MTLGKNWESACRQHLPPCRDCYRNLTLGSFQHIRKDLLKELISLKAPKAILFSYKMDERQRFQNIC
jgi:hypothetical protein